MPRLVRFVLLSGTIVATSGTIFRQQRSSDTNHESHNSEGRPHYSTSQIPPTRQETRQTVGWFAEARLHLATACLLLVQAGLVRPEVTSLFRDASLEIAEAALPITRATWVFRKAGWRFAAARWGCEGDMGVGKSEIGGERRDLGFHQGVPAGRGRDSAYAKNELTTSECGSACSLRRSEVALGDCSGGVLHKIASDLKARPRLRLRSAGNWARTAPKSSTIELPEASDIDEACKGEPVDAGKSIIRSGDDFGAGRLAPSSRLSGL